MTKSSPKVSPNLVTILSPQISPIRAIHRNFHQDGWQSCRKSDRKCLRAPTSKIAPTKLAVFTKLYPTPEARHVTLQDFTPDLQKFYTDISAISVTFRNSGGLLKTHPVGDCLGTFVSDLLELVFRIRFGLEKANRVVVHIEKTCPNLARLQPLLKYWIEYNPLLSPKHHIFIICFLNNISDLSHCQRILYALLLYSLRLSQL